MKSILSKVILAGAAAAAIAVPAVAANASTGAFAAQDMGNGVLVTSQSLSVGQMLTHDGWSGTVTHVTDDGGHYIFRMTTSLPASDTGKTITLTVG